MAEIENAEKAEKRPNIKKAESNIYSSYLTSKKNVFASIVEIIITDSFRPLVGPFGIQPYDLIQNTWSMIPHLNYGL